MYFHYSSYSVSVLNLMLTPTQCVCSIAACAAPTGPTVPGNPLVCICVRLLSALLNESVSLVCSPLHLVSVSEVESAGKPCCGGEKEAS